MAKIALGLNAQAAVGTDESRSANAAIQNGTRLQQLIGSIGSPQENNFTPSTPYVHKFRTEMCKNFELYGTCKYGDKCSFAHGKQQIMNKTDVSASYKTRICKKYVNNGYCPYGLRCQFIHDEREMVQNLSPRSETSETASPNMTPHPFNNSKGVIPNDRLSSPKLSEAKNEHKDNVWPTKPNAEPTICDIIAAQLEQ